MKPTGWIIGMLVVVAVLFGMLLGVMNTAIEEAREIGRYQIVPAVASGSNDVSWKIDTASGEVWACSLLRRCYGPFEDLRAAPEAQ